jgi:alpha-ketoglutarate-dependent taurine dioxygenase
MKIKALNSHFGVEISEVDLRDSTDNDLILTLAQTLYENRVIIIRNQKLTEENYLDFGKHWGTPIPHVLDHLRMKGHPALMVVGNTERKDRIETVRNGTALWHTDQSYEAIPASATMLYAIKVPLIGGETQICNMVAAYNDLDQATQQRIDSLQVAHQYGRGKLRSFEFAASPITTKEQQGKLPTFYHPLVMRHHITGEKALYAVGQSSYGIKGIEQGKAIELLEQLKDHALQEKYIYRHKYRVGDVAIWDTFQTLHSGRQIGIATCERDSRVLWRISVRGKPTIYSAHPSLAGR